MRYRMSSNDTLTLTAESPEESLRIGEALGLAAYPGLTLLLYGDLGMGKTVLAQGVGKALAAGKIKSPTFIIIAEHEGKIPMTHVDLYRLETGRETDALDLEQYIDDGRILLVEWAERWEGAPRNDAWKVSFIKGNDENARELTITACGEKAAEALQNAAREIQTICGETP